MMCVYRRVGLYTYYNQQTAKWESQSYRNEQPVSRTAASNRRTELEDADFMVDNASFGIVHEKYSSYSLLRQ